MPKQKDLKRLVRARMQKTGEAYTAARLHLLKRGEPKSLDVEKAGMSDASVHKATGRSWSEWVRRLDADGASEKPHREIVRHVARLGVGSWWSQMVTVGYERIRGLRERGQRRGGGYAATRSRTFPVSVHRLFSAFADPAARRRWLSAGVTVRSATRDKRMRLAWADGRTTVAGFVSKGDAKSSVAIEQPGLRDRADAEATKAAWSDAFDRLAALLS